MSSANAQKRLQKEFQIVATDPDKPFGSFARPQKTDQGKNWFVWQCGVAGPAGTPWEGAILPLTLKFSDAYPLAPPEAYFETNNHGQFPHPNVRGSDGMVCLPIFKSSWRPATKIIQILQLLHEFLDHPNINDPFNGDMAREYRTNKERYEQRVREFASLGMSSADYSLSINFKLADGTTANMAHSAQTKVELIDAIQVIKNDVLEFLKPATQGFGEESAEKKHKVEE